jgi:hypothetical protein
MSQDRYRERIKEHCEDLKCSGETKRRRINLSALTRVEYSIEVDVPVDADEDELVRWVYDLVDGDDFTPDTYYWERGSCYIEPCEEKDENQ